MDLLSTPQPRSGQRKYRNKGFKGSNYGPNRHRESLLEQIYKNQAQHARRTSKLQLILGYVLMFRGKPQVQSVDSIKSART